MGGGDSWETRRPDQSTGGAGVVPDRVRPSSGRRDREAGTGRAWVLVTKTGLKFRY